VRVDELIAAIETALGKKAIIERYPMQPGDVIQTYADIDRARAKLGYEPKTTLEAGLKKFVCWLRESQ
jgi:UDP-glucuronate 4-epimerase